MLALLQVGPGVGADRGARGSALPELPRRRRDSLPGSAADRPSLCRLGGHRPFRRAGPRRRDRNPWPGDPARGAEGPRRAGLSGRGDAGLRNRLAEAGGRRSGSSANHHPASHVAGHAPARRNLERGQAAAAAQFRRHSAEAAGGKRDGRDFRSSEEPVGHVDAARREPDGCRRRSDQPDSQRAQGPGNVQRRPPAGAEIAGTVDARSQSGSIGGVVEGLDLSPDMRESLPSPLPEKLAVLGHCGVKRRWTSACRTIRRPRRR